MRIISWTVSQSPPLQYIEVYVNDIEGIKGMGVIFPFRPTHAGLRMLACVIPGPESGLSLSLSLSWLWMLGLARALRVSPLTQTPGTPKSPKVPSTDFYFKFKIFLMMKNTASLILFSQIEWIFEYEMFWVTLALNLMGVIN